MMKKGRFSEEKMVVDLHPKLTPWVSIWMQINKLFTKGFWVAA